MLRKLDKFRNREANSLFSKYFRLILAVMVTVSAAISAIIMYYYTSNRIEMEKAEQINTISTAVQNLENTVTDISFITSYLSANPIVYSFMLKPYVPTYNANDLTVIDKPYEIIRAMIFSSSYIKSAYLYSSVSDSVLVAAASKSLSRLEDFFDRDLIEQSTSNGFIYGTTSTILGDNEVFAYVSELRLGDAHVKILLNIDIVLLTDAISSHLGNNQHLMLVSDQNTVLYSVKPNAIGQRIDNLTNGAQLDMLQPQRIKNGTSMTLAHSNLAGLSLVLVNQAAPVDNHNLTIWVILVLTLLLSAAVSAFLAYVISARLSAPLETLLDIAESPDLYCEQGYERFDFYEFRHIVASIANRFHSRTELEKALADKMTLLRRSQTLALYSQITPHFLFNTLQTINLMALETFKSDNQISDALTLLADMLRISLRNENFIPLKEELRHAKAYVDIQKLKYDHLFSVRWEVDDGLENFTLPKVIIQPLIENAILHGVKNMESGGLIQITIKSHNDGIIITVSDNGEGMTMQAMEKLSRQLTSEYTAPNDHIGLINVNQRLKITYGEQYGATISSNTIGGVSVALVVPKPEC